MKTTKLFKKSAAFCVLSAYLIGMAVPTPAFAAGNLPSGHESVLGDVAYSVNQDDRSAALSTSAPTSISNWKGGFDIGAGYAVGVQLPADGVHLSRDISSDPSEIFGSLNVPQGQFFLSNPSGILFAPGSQVNAPGLVAAAMDIEDSDFIAGNYKFAGEGGLVLQRGSIQADRYVALLGHAVKNEGTLKADGGAAVLAAGGSATLSFDDQGLVAVRVDTPVEAEVYDFNGARVADAVSNSGSIQANGGIAVLSAKAAESVMDGAINHSGIIEAKSVGEVNGIVTLGGHEGITRVSGSIDASGKNTGETGGTVHVLGDKVSLFNDARVDVSGDTGGGTALIGGDFQGKNPQIQNASQVFVGQNAKLEADALTNGDGGRVIVWSDGTTRYYGSVSARGGIAGGDGGFAEVSGKENLDFAGAVDLSAPFGLSGTLLLDPTTIVFGDTGSDDGQISDGIILSGDPGAFTISNEAIEAVTGNISVAATGNITFNFALNLANQQAGETVSFDSGDTISINDDITIAGADVDFVATNDINIGNGAGDFLTLNGGLLTLDAGGIINGFNGGAGNVILTGGAELTADAGGGIGSSSQLEVHFTNGTGTQTLNLAAVSGINVEVLNSNFEEIIISQGASTANVDVELPGGDIIDINGGGGGSTFNSVILNTQAIKPTLDYELTPATSSAITINSLVLDNSGSNFITGNENINITDDAISLSGGGELTLDSGAIINGQNNGNGNINLNASNLTLVANSIGSSSQLEIDLTNGAGTQILDITAPSNVNIEVLTDSFDRIQIDQTNSAGNIDIDLPGTTDVIDINGAAGGVTFSSVVMTDNPETTELIYTVSEAASTVAISGAMSTSGNIDITATGTITVSALVSTEAASGGTGGSDTVRSGNITMNSTGGNIVTSGAGSLLTGDATVNGSGGGADQAISGFIDLTASGALQLGTTDALKTGSASVSNNSGDSSESGDIILDATKVTSDGGTGAADISLGVASGATTNNQGALSATTDGGAGAAGAFIITSGENIYLDNVSGTGTVTVSATANEGKITVTSGQDVESTGGSHTYTADKMAILGTITATGQTATLMPQSAGEAVTLGSSTDAAANTLELSDTELDNIAATALIVGRANSGALNVTSALTTSPILNLVSGSTVGQSASITTASLSASAAGAISLTNASNDVDLVGLKTTTGNISFVDADGFTVGTVDTIDGVDTDSGSVTLTATTGNLTVFNTGAGNDIEATGTVTVTAAGDDATFTINPSAVIHSTGGAHLYTADKMALTGTITASGQNVTLRPSEATDAINLGSTGAAAGDTLELSDAELDNVVAAAITVGRSNAGVITVSSPISLEDSGVLHLVTGGSVSQSAAIDEVSLAVEAAGAVTLTNAGNEVTNLAIDTTSGHVQYTDATGFTVTTVDGITGVDTDNGDVTLIATAGTLTVANTAAANDIDATGAVSLTTSADDAMIALSATANIHSTGGAHTYTADKMDLQGTITAGAQTVTLRPNENGEAIDLGSATNVLADTLELSDGELDAVTASRLIVGRSSSGAITVSSSISPGNTDLLHLISGGVISQQAGDFIIETNFAAQTAAAITLANSGNNVSTLALFTSTGNIQYTDADTFSVGSVNSLTGVDTDSGNATLIATTGDLVLSSAVSASGNVTLTTSAAGADIRDGDGGSAANVNAGTAIFNTSGSDGNVGAAGASVEVTATTLNTTGVGGTAYVCLNGGGTCDNSFDQQTTSGLTIENGKITGGDNFQQYASESSEVNAQGDDVGESEEEDGDSSEAFSGEAVAADAAGIEPPATESEATPEVSESTFKSC